MLENLTSHRCRCQGADCHITGVIDVGPLLERAGDDEKMVALQYATE